MKKLLSAVVISSTLVIGYSPNAEAFKFNRSSKKSSEKQSSLNNNAGALKYRSTRSSTKRASVDKNAAASAEQVAKKPVYKSKRRSFSSRIKSSLSKLKDKAKKETKSFSEKVKAKKKDNSYIKTASSLGSNTLTGSFNKEKIEAARDRANSMSSNAHTMMTNALNSTVSTADSDSESSREPASEPTASPAPAATAEPIEIDWSKLNLHKFWAF